MCSHAFTDLQSRPVVAAGCFSSLSSNPDFSSLTALRGVLQIDACGPFFRPAGSMGHHTTAATFLPGRVIRDGYASGLFIHRRVLPQLFEVPERGLRTPRRTPTQDC